MTFILLAAITFVFFVGPPVFFIMIAYIYPAYMSFKAQEAKKEDLLKHYVRYWIVFSFLKAFSPVLYYVPHWNVIKYFVVLWL